MILAFFSPFEAVSFFPRALTRTGKATLSFRFVISAFRRTLSRKETPSLPLQPQTAPAGTTN